MLSKKEHIEVFTRQDIIKSVQEFVTSAADNDTPIEKILLFGSYARGNPHKYSDIDLAVFSSMFTENHFENNRMIQFAKRLPQMQLHLYPLSDYHNNLFVQEIKKHAIDLTPKFCIR